MPRKDREARNQYIREWTAARRAAFFEGKSCVKCGSTERLELDHIDPSQKISHSIWSWSDERRLAEIAKCQVLCRPCHEVKTAQDYDTGLPGCHGWWRYRQGCRCDECRAANTEHSRTVRANKKAREES
jgi:5-methylcytosine-specific restriction endonuclease McrA